jgi:RND family efflux transporter MFP subunit
MKTTLLPIAIVIALLLAGCGEAPQTNSAKPLSAATVSTAVASLQEHGSIEILPGTVKAASAATLMARISGVVGRITATPGTVVAAGTVLVEIDALEMAAKRDQAKAVAAQAAADFERTTLLFEKQLTTKAEFDAAQARAAGSAAAAVEAEIMVGYTRMTAPFAGVVVRKHVEVGDLLSPGRPVIDLEDPASLRLEVELPASQAARVVVGTTLRIQIASSSIDQEAAVVEVTPAADPISRTVLAKLALPTDAKGLRSGQFGRVTIPVAGGALLSVPAAAVVQRGQLDAVFVVQDGKALMRLVRLGGTDGGNTVIRAGLKNGDIVVVDGAESVRDGQSVTVH